MAEQVSLESVGPRVGLRVHGVWYVQPTAHPGAAIRIATNLAKGQPEPKRCHPPRTQRAASDHDRAKAMQVLAMAAALSAGGSHG